ncbi:hypothetical protein SPRG_06875 [Saprolegnia parasitica CBS 223.65]|uniref:TOG domain-containing protein n=1 Tax=Saprolegnia parasitica (strain CBS 223.65) TaxID=695850 RepID=A0A067CLC5_SAPPC|nr:hypothetical protein SPRG_06875 [Saprolegnia parasitica CBS 223.65]KDO27607.1 hypothetical protein SPRG_06875 [Saprolegnia parasitica CBS 223.65]|eukprot:XP_012201729.1 hypothetical protein SPRG_06875 [Saprolegnia parasitica CBS 223.65]
MRKVRFHVLSCSGEDPAGPAALLNEHDNTGTGYLTPKNCEYPQELVIELEATARITQIQVLSHQCYIATKIELYLSTDGAAFSRLGFLSLKSNKESQYTARELKTVHIDAFTRYIKLKLHQCYINEKNLYSQVGLVAINVNGEVPEEAAHEVELDSLSHVHQPLPTAPTPTRSVSKAKSQPPKEASSTSASMDDMRFDAKTAAKIREIHLAKEKAVAMEDYDQAKRLKALEEQLKSVGLQLARLEAAKRDAVENEDYDAAKRIKDEIAQLENELSLGVNAPARPVVDSSRAPMSTSSRAPVKQTSRNEHVESGYPPAVPSLPKPAPRKAAPAVVQEAPSHAAADDDAGGAQHETPTRGGPNPHFEGLDDVDDLGDPEPLPSALEKESAEMIEVIGLYLTQCFYSNIWNHRDAALRKVQLDLPAYELPPESVLPVLSTLVQSGIGDRISQVSLSALSLCDAMLLYAQDHADALGSEAIAHTFTNPIVQLVNKLGEPQAKIRDEVTAVLLKLAAADDVGTSVVGGHVCRRTTKKALAIKHLQGRLGLVKDLLAQYGPTADDFSLPGIMTFLEENGAFAHQSKDIRELAKDITVFLHQVGGAEVEPFLKTLRPKQLEEYEAAFEAASAPKKKPAPASKAPAPASKAPTPASRSRAPPLQDAGSDTDSNASVDDGTCPFCDEHNDAFDNERLDQHFWAECPMLTQCKMCGQVIEISTLNEHLLVECELKQNHKECPRCHEAITLKYFNQHVQENDCVPMPDPNDGNRCPLCHDDIGPRKRGWKTHLLHERCPQNPRTTT